MTAAQWARVRELFDLALDRGSDDVESWLPAQEADGAVRDDVRSLLHHHAIAGAFLEEPVSLTVDDDPSLAPGAAVGAYTVVREVGRGGVGRVYLARDERLGRHVALKALNQPFTLDTSARERFRREARAAAALTHPGICAVYAIEEHDGELFIATEYIEGQTWRRLIADGRRPDAVRALSMARELASALACAHRAGITHRDLKPENVMLTVDGRVKVLDFGLARMTGSNLPALTGAVSPHWLGTPAYMTPEQLDGVPADERSDVFAFGLVAYELVSGVHPFGASSALAIAGRILEAEPVPLATRVPGVDPVLASVVNRCLMKRPADRFASADEVTAALADRVRIADAGAGRAPVRASRSWWRIHQGVTMALYVTAAVVSWRIADTRHGPAVWVLLAVAAATAAGGVVRGHLMFTDRQRPRDASRERRRTARLLPAIDVVVACGLLADAVLLVSGRLLPAALVVGLALGLVLSAVLIEPATSAAAFDDPQP